jgi:hypothetical protein
MDPVRTRISTGVGTFRPHPTPLQRTTCTRFRSGLAYRQGSATECGKAKKRRKCTLQLYIYKGAHRLLTARQLRSVLSFALPSAIVCHCNIERRICSTAFERIDVIDDVSGTPAAGSAGSRTRMLRLKLFLAGRIVRERDFPAPKMAASLSFPPAGH